MCTGLCGAEGVPRGLPHRDEPHFPQRFVPLILSAVMLVRELPKALPLTESFLRVGNVTVL